MLDQPNKNGHSNGNGGLVVEDLQNLTFSVHRKVFVSPEILEDENRAIFDKMLDLCRPRLGGEEPRRFPHPPCRRPPGDLLPRQEGRGPRAVQRLPPPRRAGLPRARGQHPAVPVHLSRLVLQHRRLDQGHPRRRRLSAGLRQAGQEPDAGGAARALQGFLFRQSRSRRGRPAHLSRRRQGLHRPRRRSVAVRPHGDHLRHAGIRHQGELEAPGREQRRRLPPRHHAFDLAQLHAQLRRQRHADQGPHAADQGLRQGPRQRPSHHRQSELPRPPGGALDFGVRRGGQGRHRRDPRRSWSSGSARRGRSASPTPTATSASSPISSSTTARR